MHQFQGFVADAKFMWVWASIAYIFFILLAEQIIRNDL